MWEDQVNAAGVNVERLAERFHRHRRAFDVPTGTALAQFRLPERLARLRGFPQHKITDVFLVIFVGVNTLTGACDVALKLHLRQPPVSLEAPQTPIAPSSLLVCLAISPDPF